MNFTELLANVGKWLIHQSQPRAINLYRVVRRRGGFEPQMSYSSGYGGGLFWTPLTMTGHWADPNSFSFGKVTKKPAPMTRHCAEEAIARARLINGMGHVLSVASTGLNQGQP